MQQRIGWCSCWPHTSHFYLRLLAFDMPRAFIGCRFRFFFLAGCDFRYTHTHLLIIVNLYGYACLRLLCFRFVVSSEINFGYTDNLEILVL